MAEGELVLRNPKHWKAMSHPLRQAIMRHLVQAELTNEELADKIGEPSGKLYFHTKKLLEAGLIELSHERRKGPLTEKVYRLAASGYRIPVLDDGSAPPMSHFIENALSLYMAKWRKEHGGEFSQAGFHYTVYVTAAKETEYQQRIFALMQEIEANMVEPNTPDARLISFSALAHRAD
jgi:DNA-binding transcriptional ArsR family regulator